MTALAGHPLFYYFVVFFMLKDVKEESYETFADKRRLRKGVLSKGLKLKSSSITLGL